MIWEWRHEDPIIDVQMFKNFNFAVANLMMFTLGVLLFSSLVMMPQFLQTLMGYTAESAGLVLSGSGLVILFEMPVVGELTTKIPAKYIMAFGWLTLAVGMYYSTMEHGSADQLPVGGMDCASSSRSGWGFCSCRSRWPAYIGVAPERATAFRDWSISCATSAAAWGRRW